MSVCESHVAKQSAKVTIAGRYVRVFVDGIEVLKVRSPQITYEDYREAKDPSPSNSSDAQEAPETSQDASNRPSEASGRSSGQGAPSNATITIWKDRIEYRVQTTLKEGIGGSIPYSEYREDRTRSLALGEALDEILRHCPQPVVRVIHGA